MVGRVHPDGARLACLLAMVLGVAERNLSRVDGPYAAAISAMNCCVDAWWPEVAAQGGTLCSGGCPNDMVCNQ